jgi:hypothetical protein
MAGVRDSDDEEPRDDSGSSTRLLMGAVLVLAVAATVVLILSDSAKMLRLGVLAALWAALLGVFLATRFRKVATQKQMEAADLQSVYELELEREVAARREYELQIEAEARKRVEEASREDMAALRAELRVLRESLERLTGGEVLVERFALQARSTRMRTLGGAEAQPRAVPTGQRSIVAGEPPTVDASTELMARPDVPTTPPPQAMTAVSTPVRGQPQQPTTVARPVSRQQQAGIRTQRSAPAPAPDWPAPTAPQRPAAQQVRRPVPLQQQARPARPPDARPPVPPADPTEQLERPWPAPGDAGLSTRLGGQPQAPAERRRPAEPDPPQVRPAVRPQRVEPVERSRHRSNERPVETTGGHRRVEDGRTATGRRAKVEEPARWSEDSRTTTGRRAKVEEPARWSEDGRTTSGRRAKVEEPARWSDDPETTGSHSTGRSVTEILAAHTNPEDSPRRHRRRAD